MKRILLPLVGLLVLATACGAAGPQTIGVLAVEAMQKAQQCAGCTAWQQIMLGAAAFDLPGQLDPIVEEMQARPADADQISAPPAGQQSYAEQRIVARAFVTSDFFSGIQVRGTGDAALPEA